MKVLANTLRPGNILDYEGKLWTIVKHQLNQPGKGAAVIQIEMRDIKSGNKTNVRFRTQENVDIVRVEDKDYQFLFAEGDHYTFMNVDTYDQITIEKDLIGDPYVYLQEGMNVICGMHENDVLSVRLPVTVIMEITEADAVVKGQTASSSYKPAVLENGVKVLVPPHIEAGTKIVVRTEDNSYVERAK